MRVAMVNQLPFMELVVVVGVLEPQVEVGLLVM
jgi:hypothetical protein